MQLTETNSANSLGKHVLQMLVNTGVLDADFVAGFYKELFCSSVRTQLEATVAHGNERPDFPSDTIWKLLTVGDVTLGTCNEIMLSSYSAEALRYPDTARPLSAYFNALSMIVSPHTMRMLSRLQASFHHKNEKVIRGSIGWYAMWSKLSYMGK